MLALDLHMQGLRGKLEKSAQFLFELRTFQFLHISIVCLTVDMSVGVQQIRIRKGLLCDYGPFKH